MEDNPMKLSLKNALRVIHCCMVGCGLPRWRQKQHDSGFMVRIKGKNACKCPDD